MRKIQSGLRAGSHAERDEIGDRKGEQDGGERDGAGDEQRAQHEQAVERVGQRLAVVGEGEGAVDGQEILGPEAEGEDRDQGGGEEEQRIDCGRRDERGPVRRVAAPSSRRCHRCPGRENPLRIMGPRGVVGKAALASPTEEGGT